MIVSCTYMITIMFVQDKYHVRTRKLSCTYNIVNVYVLDTIMYVHDSYHVRT